MFISDAMMVGAAGVIALHHNAKAGTVLLGAHLAQRVVLPRLDPAWWATPVLDLLVAVAGVRAGYAAFDSIYYSRSSALLIAASIVTQCNTDGFTAALLTAWFNNITACSPSLVRDVGAEIERLIVSFQTAAEEHRAAHVAGNEDKARAILDRVAPLRCRGAAAADAEVAAAAAAECSICLGEIDPNLLHRRLPCGHAFHPACVDAWFSIYSNPACPLCRRQIQS